MSGPKSADYYLTAEQRRQLAEQRRVNELKKKIENYAGCCTYSQSALDEYSSNAEELLNVMSTDNGYSALSNQLSSVIDKLKSSIEMAKNLNDSASLSGCYADIKSLNREKEATLLLMKEKNAQNISMLKNEYSHQLEEAMSTDFGIIKSKSQIEIDKVLQQIKEKLSEAMNHPNLSDELISEIDAANEKAEKLRDISLIKNFRAITVEGIIKRCDEYSQLYTEFEELQVEYQTLCELEENQFCEFKCCREDVEQLRTLIEEMHLSAAKADEQEYISRSIDEVMTEMGYKLIGNRSVTKKSGRRFHSELYTFSEGTAVNITHSSNGQITMELAGIDSNDRMPTDNEADALCTEMESFCGAFSEFEKRLAEKGVMSRHISIMPPTSEYAQIINVNDYELTSTADYSELSVNRRVQTEKSKRME